MQRDVYPQRKSVETVRPSKIVRKIHDGIFPIASGVSNAAPGGSGLRTFPFMSPGNDPRLLHQNAPSICAISSAPMVPGPMPTRNG